MKNLFYACMIMVFTSCSYAKNTPEVVKNAFTQKFPNATHVKWTKENDHEYEADFKIDGVKHSANFTDSGMWLETERLIDYQQLPEAVKKMVQLKQSEGKLKAVAKIETSKNTLKYEVEIKNGSKTIEYFYDEHGIEIK